MSTPDREQVSVAAPQPERRRRSHGLASNSSGRLDSKPMTENDHDHDTDAVHEDDERVRHRSSGDVGTVWWFIAATFAFVLPQNFGAGETIQSIGWWSGIVLILVGAAFLIRDLRRKQ